MSWEHDNRQFLLACLERVKTRLRNHMERPHSNVPNVSSEELWPVWEGDPEQPPLIRVLSDTFQLSVFERDLLLLCVGMEVDPEIPMLAARANGDPRLAYPTFSLALSCIAGAHWDALAPAGRLRANSLVEIESSLVLLHARLTAPTRISYYLVGTNALDERIVRYASSQPLSGPLAPSQEERASQIAVTCMAQNAPAVQLFGRSQMAQAAFAARCAQHLELGIVRMQVDALPQAYQEMDQLLGALNRDAALSPFILLLDCHHQESNDQPQASERRLVSSFKGILFIATHERRSIGSRSVLTVELEPPVASERRVAWSETLHRLLDTDSIGCDDAIEKASTELASTFDIEFDVMQAATQEAAGKMAVQDDPPTLQAWTSTLWDSVRSQARPKLEELARRVEPRATWDDLVLPESTLQTLKEIELFMRRRSIVDVWWGRDKIRGGNGHGMSVLFAGPSGTGKTFSAEVLAKSLNLDLYRIDLSAVVSKYIGETEKNLRGIFEAAESGASVLLFDEADAIFGKRSDVKDSHDRYANIEVSYLLQRIETFRGLAILTTNMKSSIDQAFQRRIRFIVDFPFPSEQERTVMWRRVFPKAVSTDAIHFDKLARLNVSGSSIRNIAEHALFLAADAMGTATEPSLSMGHLFVAAKRECEKLHQPMPASDARGWE